jgi:hypothetical protein
LIRSVARFKIARISALPISGLFSSIARRTMSLDQIAPIGRFICV